MLLTVRPQDGLRLAHRLLAQRRNLPSCSEGVLSSALDSDLRKAHINARAERYFHFQHEQLHNRACPLRTVQHINSTPPTLCASVECNESIYRARIHCTIPIK